jgi:hypothetical protein
MSQSMTATLWLDKGAALWHPGCMTEVEAFLIALTLLGGATFVARKYLSGDARLALAIVAALAHLA